MNNIIYHKRITNKKLKSHNIFISKDSLIGKNVQLSDNVSILGKSIIDDECVIENSTVLDSYIGAGSKVKSSYIEQSKVEKDCNIGPFSHLRPNCQIGERCKIGNFVEIKNSKLGNECKVSHLTYVGDAELGENCNLGCGVVFCNFNGEIKQKSIIGNNVFIGSNVNIIAPCKIEDGAYIAAGSTITDNIGADELAIARARQVNKTGFNNPYTRKK